MSNMSNMSDYEEACAEVAACLEFLAFELSWEYFREEMLYFSDEEKRSTSMKNAQKLKNYLAESGHGIAVLRELKELRRLRDSLHADTDLIKGSPYEKL